jgi:predicted alpha/beta-hydrolase family hydrolase
VSAIDLSIAIDGAGSVSAILQRPDRARCMLLLAHGAGAGMRHSFMNALAGALAQRGVATLRYQFPYTEAGRKRPDRPALLEATVRAAAAAAASDLPLFAGGKSMGGRMTSQAQAASPLPGVRGLVFFGFPLHPARAPATTRADHLARVAIPMLFLQGTRDALAELPLLTPITRRLTAATLHIIDGADHGFALPARTRDPLAELAAATAAWTTRLS